MMVTSVTLNVLPWFGSVAMRPPSLCLEDRGARRDLLALVEQVPGASVGLKVAALLLVIEGQRPGWIAQLGSAAQARAAGCADGQGTPRARGASGALTAGIRLESRALGRTDPGGAS